MLKSLKEMQGYEVTAVDGGAGKIHDFYFDDESWTVRYLVVETGGWLSRERVLVSPYAFRDASWAERRIGLSLTRKQVEDSPEIDLDKPVSRQHEETYNRHFGWSNYWGAWSGMGMAAGFGVYPGPPGAPPPAAPPGTYSDEVQGDSHLRSCREVTGYRIHALDGELGPVEDFIADDEGWAIRYLVIDTTKWWFGKKVLVAPRWARTIRWEDRVLEISLSRETIEKAPEYDAGAPVNRGYEVRLYDYYGRPSYWRDDAPEPPGKTAPVEAGRPKPP